jgi:hypothetical protein
MNNNQPDRPRQQKQPGSSRSWRIARRTLLGFAILATLLAVFHTVENWRGKRAWKNVQRQIEAKGETLDWNAYIPKPVPADQNFFAAPKMTEWFVKRSRLSTADPQANTNNPFKSYSSFDKNLKPLPSPDSNSTLFAVFHIQSAEAALKSSSSNVVLRFSDPEAPVNFEELLRERLSGFAVSAVHGIFVAEPDNRPPVQIDLVADIKPTVDQMRQQFLSDQARLSERLRLDEDGTNAFKVQVDKARVYLAADFLEWTDADMGDLAMVQKALERPLARIEGDYSRPFESPFPNFVRTRTVMQMLADRAVCHLLLKDPQAALEELTLLHGFAGRMNTSPHFLVSVMIHVAVTRLYTSVIEDGLRLHAWQEPQLLALEEQLKSIELVPELVEALRVERAGSCKTFEISAPSDLAELMNRDEVPTLLQKARKVVETLFIPRGWWEQNRAVMARYGMQTLECFDPENQTVSPEKIDRVISAIQAELAGFHPYTVLAKIAVPNTAKAVRICVRNQASVQSALIACKLERYHRDHGTYPETLSGLVPRYGAGFPLEPMSDEPLKYRPVASGYLLYSVGWNQKDDGGSAASVQPNETASISGDWVWR